MLYKFINENQIKPYKGGFVVIDNRIYTNPTEETIRKAGYKDLVESEIPEYDEQTQYLETKYIDGDVITTVYEVKDIPFMDIPEEPEVIE
jgi:hypothetical protein